MQCNALLAEVEWPSAFVAVALIALIGIIMVTAIRKYNTHEVLQIWAGLGVLVGIMTGSFGTYFFADKAIQQEKMAARENAKRADLYASQLADKNALISTLTKGDGDVNGAAASSSTSMDSGDTVGAADNFAAAPNAPEPTNLTHTDFHSPREAASQADTAVDYKTNASTSFDTAPSETTPAVLSTPTNSTIFNPKW